MTALSSSLTFDPIAHAYYKRGARVPNVTGILKDLSLSPPYPPDKGQMDFGQTIHKCCLLLLHDRLEIEPDNARPGRHRYPGVALKDGSPGELLWPYLDAFRQKVQEYKIIPIHTEFLVYHDLLGYAGTLDVHCTIFGGEEAIIDYKTGNPPEATALQLAAYDMALSRTLGLGGDRKRRRRFAMHLFNDEVKQTGKARMIEFVDPSAYATFEGACSIWKWKNRNGSKP